MPSIDDDDEDDLEQLGDLDDVTDDEDEGNERPGDEGGQEGVESAGPAGRADGRRVGDVTTTLSLPLLVSDGLCPHGGNNLGLQCRIWFNVLPDG